VSLLPVCLPPSEQLHVAACLAVAIIYYAVLEWASLSVSHCAVQNTMYKTNSNW